MKRSDQIMEILEAYDLTGSYRAAAELAGCDHHTVRRYVQLRAAGTPGSGRQAPRPRAIDEHLGKIEEMVENSRGRVRADKVHDRLRALGFKGGERTTRRAVARAKQAWQAGHRRVFRPWITEPGLWLQWDWGEGPRIKGKRTFLWCAWLAWSRFRVVLPTMDKTMPTVIACLDATLRRVGGVPVYALTDNEKTVTVEHVARIAVRNPLIVDVGRHYGLTVRTCVPADPQTKGGSEATVRIAKADLVPTETNLLDQYRTFAALEMACRAFCDEVNTREHRETRRVPAEALSEELQRLHPLPLQPFTAVFGQTRRVNWDATVAFGGVRYSVPHQLIDARVWVRNQGEEVIVTVETPEGPAEVARHAQGTPGNPQINAEHYPHPVDAGERLPEATSAEEALFLSLGSGAADWLVEAAAAGARRIRPKMAEAVELAKLHGRAAVDQALGTAALAGRLREGDLRSILDHQRHNGTALPHQRSEDHSLQPGTSSWARLGNPLGQVEVGGDR
jgi:transposase